MDILECIISSLKINNNQVKRTMKKAFLHKGMTKMVSSIWHENQIKDR